MVNSFTKFFYSFLPTISTIIATLISLIFLFFFSSYKNTYVIRLKYYYSLVHQKKRIIIIRLILTNLIQKSIFRSRDQKYQHFSTPTYDYTLLIIKKHDVSKIGKLSLSGIETARTICLSNQPNSPNP